MRLKETIYTSLALLVLVSAPLFAADSAKKAPAVDTETLSGEALSLAAYEGKVVLLNFWGVH